MPGTPTPNLGLTVPTIGGDNNIWGAELNADLMILDGLGVATVAPPFSADMTAVAGVSVEKTYRGSSGAGTVNLTLPTPVGIAGKIFVIIKIDAAIGNINIIGTINDQPNYSLGNQYQYVRVQSNGTTYDVIGNN